MPYCAHSAEFPHYVPDAGPVCGFHVLRWCPTRPQVQAMLHEFAPGNYRFIPGPFQYSAGVAALPGYGIERVRFMIRRHSRRALRSRRTSSARPGGR